MSGKTRLVMKLLEHPECFNPKPEHVYFYYSEWQDSYQALEGKLAEVGIKLHLRQGSNLKLDDIEKHEGQSLYIVDDATEETSSSKDIAAITTNGRHKNASLWLLWHTLYSRHAASRIITANTSYFFFLPSVRLTSQLKTLDTQLAYKGKLVEAYRLAVSSTDDEYRYLFVNMAPYCDPKLRLKGQVHHKDHQIVYLT